jgi:dihydrofolate reductase
MPCVVSELLVSLDTAARGTQAPGYFGFMGPQFGSALRTVKGEPHRTLMGRKTYELLNRVPREARDEGWHKTTKEPGYLFSRTLDQVEWPGLELVRSEMIDFVRRLKGDNGPELRVLGSLSIARQLAQAQLLDCLRLYVCPVVLPETGVEPVFAGWGDTAFALTGCEVLDDRIVKLEYRPDGPPPNTGRSDIGES